MVGNPPVKELFALLEEMIVFKAPIEKVYRAIILWSLTEGSIKAYYFESLMKDMVESYGLREMNALLRLLEQGLINVSTSMINFGNSAFNQLVNVRLRHKNRLIVCFNDLFQI